MDGRFRYYAFSINRVTDLILFSAEPTAAGGLDLSRLDAAPWADIAAWEDPPAGPRAADGRRVGKG